MTDHPGPIIAARDGLQVVNCHACGYAHLDPLPDPAALAAYYSASFWQTKGAGWLAKYEAQRDWITAKDGDTLSVIEQHTAGRALLDIGAGWGFFVGTAAERGWDAVGLDPSVEASEYARAAGRSVHTLGWEQFWPARRYDAVTAFWLLEHLPQPLDFLRFCRGCLADGGVLALAVPNDFSAAQSLANEKVGRPYYWIHPTHVLYLTPATLGNLLGRAGFRVVDTLATFPMEKFLLDGRDYTVDDAVGDACHAEVRQNELDYSRELRLEVARWLGRIGTGRDLIVFATPEG